MVAKRLALLLTACCAGPAAGTDCFSRAQEYVSGCIRENGVMATVRCGAESREVYEHCDQAQAGAPAIPPPGIPPPTAGPDELVDRLQSTFREEGYRLFAQCRMDGLAGCSEHLRNLSGQAVDAISESMAAEAGLRDAIPTFLQACYENATAGTLTRREIMEACREGLAERVENMTGGRPPLTIIEEMERTAGLTEAGHHIRRCLTNATDLSSQAECICSHEAMRRAAAVTGRNASDFTCEDMRRAAVEMAERSVCSVVAACQERETTAAGRRACPTALAAGLKREIAQATSRNLSSILDDEVHQHLRRCTQHDTCSAMSLRGESERGRLDAAGDVLAAATGMTRSQVGDSLVQRACQEENERRLGERVMDCFGTLVEPAPASVGGGQLTRSQMAGSCVARAVRETVMPGQDGNVSDADVQQGLERAAVSALTDARDACQGTAQDCLQRMRQVADQVMGRTQSQTEISELMRRAAERAGLEACAACREAQAASSGAQCRDIYQRFKEVLGEVIPSSAAERQRDERSVMQRLAQASMEGATRLCATLGAQSRAACEQQLQGASSQCGVDQLYRGIEGATAAVVNAKRAQAQREAQARVVGERMRACMQAESAGGENASAKAACMAGMTALTDGLGLQTGSDVETVLMDFYSMVVADGVASCNASQAQACRSAALQQARDAGMKRGATLVNMKLAFVRAAVRAWVQAKEADNTTADEAADELAKQEFLRVSGAEEGAWEQASGGTQSIKERVRVLARAMLRGVMTRVVRRMLIEVGVVVDASNCSAVVKAAIEGRIGQAAQTANAAAGTVRPGACMLVQGRPNYGSTVNASGMQDADMEQVADAITANLSGANLGDRRLGGRRLVSVTEAYASQAIEECPEDDLGCTGNSDSGADGGDAGGDAGGGDAVSGALGLAPAAMLVAASLLATLAAL